MHQNSRRSGVVIAGAIAAALVVGVAVGRATQDKAPAAAAASSAWAPCIPAANPSATATARRREIMSVLAAPRASPGAETGAKTAAREGAGAPPPAASCDERLDALRAIVKSDEELRAAESGTPIPIASRASAPRFQQGAMSSAVAQAFVEARVPGRMDGIDCSEWPCIAFGRIAGTEDEMEKLEHTRALAPYDDDISSILLWTVSDDEAREDDPHAEQALYAIAYYTRADRDALGDNLDRRVRTRVNELWNTMSPSDETAARAP